MALDLQESNFDHLDQISGWTPGSVTPPGEPPSFLEKPTLTREKITLADRKWQLGAHKIIPVSLARLPWVNVTAQLVFDSLSLQGNTDVTTWPNAPNTSTTATGNGLLRTEGLFCPVVTLKDAFTLPTVTLHDPVSNGFTITMVVRNYVGKALFDFSNTIAASVDFSGNLVVDDGQTSNFLFANSDDWLVLSMVRTGESWFLVVNGGQPTTLVPTKPFPIGTVTWDNNTLGAQDLDLVYFSLVEGAMSTPAVHALHRHLNKRLGADKQQAVPRSEHANTFQKYLANVSRDVATRLQLYRQRLYGNLWGMGLSMDLSSLDPSRDTFQHAYLSLSTQRSIDSSSSSISAHTFGTAAGWRSILQQANRTTSMSTNQPPSPTGITL